MNPDVQRERQSFTSYEYKEINVKEEQAYQANIRNIEGHCNISPHDEEQD